MIVFTPQALLVWIYMYVPEMIELFRKQLYYSCPAVLYRPICPEITLYDHEKALMYLY